MTQAGLGFRKTPLSAAGEEVRWLGAGWGREREADMGQEEQPGGCRLGSAVQR